MYPAAESVVCKEPLSVIEIFFITGATVEDNSASECIHTVAATYGCKILQLYEYEAKDCEYKAESKLYPKNTSSCNIKDRRLLSRSLSSRSKLKLITQ